MQPEPLAAQGLGDPGRPEEAFSPESTFDRPSGPFETALPGARACAIVYVRPSRRGKVANGRSALAEWERQSGSRSSATPPRRQRYPAALKLQQVIHPALHAGASPGSAVPGRMSLGSSPWCRCLRMHLISSHGCGLREKKAAECHHGPTQVPDLALPCEEARHRPFLLTVCAW